MKKFFLIVGVLFSFFFANISAAATTCYIYNNIADNILGFGFNVDLDSIEDFAIETGTALNSAGGYWEIWKANDPSIGVQAMDYTTSAPLTTGLVLTITSDEDFSISNFKLGGSGSDGSYEGEWILTYDQAINSYTINAVPIPSSLLLFGGGICILLVISRKKRGYTTTVLNIS